MAENYKRLYEHTKKMIAMYQDELIPGFRKQIEEQKAKLAESEKNVIQLRKQWQDAEMHICTMCGHFGHKKNGDVVYGNKTCGEICGYPFCVEKFTPWIHVSERLPEANGENVLVIVSAKYGNIRLEKAFLLAMYDADDGWILEMFPEIDNPDVTHWMPLPEPPKEE